MYISDNLNILSIHFPDLYKLIKDMGKVEGQKSIRTETARNGMPTIAYYCDSGPVYLHSKYDPAAEALRLIGQFKDVDRYKHVFFYGVGMGYHVEEFCRNWSDIRYTLYEPEPGILMSFLRERQLEKFDLSHCKGIYTGRSREDVGRILQKFVYQINGEVLFIVLPSYERVFESDYKSFLEIFRTAVMNKRASLQAETDFQKLWVTNSIRNFREVIDSPNVLLDKKRYLEGRPAIIAAAGPSLKDELENIRIIKERKLAYIFTVGSSINSLLEDDIYPDAVCIYDPGANTDNVIRKIKEQGINIPLIFGSSVFYGAVEDYPGTKLHMLTNQDTVSAYFLKGNSGKELPTIIDAPSISIIALQLLISLGCAPIILVGQNFAYRDNRYYSEGIEYKNRPGELHNVDLSNAIETEDVHGDKVQTNKLFNHMRSQMEMYIEYCGCKNIINTTKGGAVIKGTVYKPLEELLNNELTVSAVDERWVEESDFHYDIDYMISQGKLMSEDMDAAESLINVLIGELRILNSDSRGQMMEKALNAFIQSYNKLIGNRFFNCVLRPMNRVQFEMISKNIPDISLKADVADKARFIAGIFGDVFDACAKDMNEVKYDFYDMLEEIMENDIKVLTFTIMAS